LLLLEAEERERQRRIAAQRRAEDQAAHDRHMRELCDENDIRSVHPYIDVFPMFPQEQLEDLAASIAKAGLLFPITLDKGATRWPQSVDRWDLDTDLLGVQNGIIELRTGEPEGIWKADCRG
jgi:hypothetical protein